MMNKHVKSHSDLITFVYRNFLILHRCSLEDKNIYFES